MRRRVDDRPRHARALPQCDAVGEHRVRPEGGTGSDAAVVADVRRPLDLLAIGDLDALSEPDVAADANSGDVQAHLLLEGVEVCLPKLVEIPDVLPVAVQHVAVDRAPT